MRVVKNVVCQIGIATGILAVLLLTGMLTGMLTAAGVAQESKSEPAGGAEEGKATRYDLLVFAQCPAEGLHAGISGDLESAGVVCD